jgi:threonine dehydrogenase-like Zn-dependent dehydrogenase
MQALRVKDRTASVADVAMPVSDGEALIRVVMSGICNTDLEIVAGYAGFEGTIGHEFVGVVEDCSAAPEWKGKRVVGEINAGCGICPLCLSGDPRHCPERTVLGIHGRDGAHAEFLTLPVRNLVELPENVSDESAVFTEPLAAAFGIIERVRIEPEISVAVVGDGKLGLLCAMTARLNASSVLLVGKHREKLAIAEAAGVETVLLGGESARARTFDVVIEASGSESGFATALDLVRPRGVIVLKSTFHGTPKWEAARVVVDEISIVGSRCGRLAPAVELLASNRISVDRMITEERPLASGVAALEVARKPGILKVLLRP